MKMKGAILGWGTLVAIAFISVAAVVWVNTTTNVYKKVTDKAGDVVSIINTAEMVRKMFDPGLKLAAARATWELGLRGGSDREVYWSDREPKMDELKENFILKVKELLPSGATTANGKEVSWMENELELRGLGTPPCGPPDSSACFIISGYQNLTVFDVETSSWNRLKHDIHINVTSSYFKLLSVGRNIFENEEWHTTPGNAVFDGQIFKMESTNCSSTLAGPIRDRDLFPISNLVSFSLECGWGSKPGLVSLKPWSKEKAQQILSDIAEAMGRDLKRRHGLDFTLAPEIKTAVSEGGKTRVKIQTSISIVDPDMLVPVLPGEGSVTIEGKTFPLARQELRIKTLTEMLV